MIIRRQVGRPILLSENPSLSDIHPYRFSITTLIAATTNCDTFPQLQSSSRKSRVGLCRSSCTKLGVHASTNCRIVVGVFVSHKFTTTIRQFRSSVGKSDDQFSVGESILICFLPGTGAIPHFSVWSDSPSPLPASIHCNSWSAISASTKLSNHSWGVLSVSHKFTTTILDHPSASRTTNIVS